MFVSNPFQYRIFENIYLWISCQFIHDMLKRVGSNGIITINKGDIFTLCLSYSKISSITQTTIFLMKNLYFFIFLCIFITKFGAVIRRFIIYENNLIVGE